MLRKVFLVIIIGLIIAAVSLGQRKKHSPVGQVRNEPVTETVTVYADKMTGDVQPLQGFLTGIGHADSEQFNQVLVRNLKPRFWRIPDWLYYDKIAPFKPQVTFIVGEQYANTHGGYKRVKPWEDWNAWEDFFKAQVKKSKTEHKPVAFWDVWGEPDLGGGTSWNGSYSQLVEAFARAYRAIKSEDPDARVVGPSVSEFYPRFREGSEIITGIDRFISDLSERYGVRLDEISWHELGSEPQEVPMHAKELRTFLRAHNPGYEPSFHINEFSSAADHLIPGWTVGWLSQLETANIAVASRACWDVRERDGTKWNDCWAGLDGLLTRDNQQPRQVYFVHQVYGAMTGKRLTSESTALKTAILASRDDARKEIQLLIGRYNFRKIGEKGPSADVVLRIADYPYGASSMVRIEKIANENIPSVSNGFSRVSQETFSVKDGVLAIPLKEFQDGEAYHVFITRPGG